MPVNISEANLETIIEASLTAAPGQLGEPRPAYHSDVIFRPGGYLKRAPQDYDRQRCLDTQLALRFVQATQPQTWDKYVKQFQADAAERFLNRLAQLIGKYGALTAFRKGFKDSGCQFKLVYFRPGSRLNPDQQKKYEGNLFSVIRQLRYRPESDKSQPELDLTLFLNGLPLFTVELKNNFTGQTVADAIKQYRADRSPREPLFQQGRCLAHFAVDNELVYFTTHLRGEKTRFFPFNQGYNNGAGNPPAGITGSQFPNACLWQQIWAKDSVLNLIDQFIQMYDDKDEKGRKTGQKVLIFPRYHQLDAARRLIADVRANGPGQRCLIQHSAGSGKTMTIAWLAHQLAGLYDDQNERIFDSVIIIITDRRALDRQLQRQAADFEQVRGVVENISRTSKQLKEALEAGKHIIVTTLQKFPVISRQVQELAGHRFAVIVDEAHSSQSGASTQHMNRAITPKDLDDAANLEAGEPEDMEDVLIREAELRRQPPHVSTFAFTATPKQKTLQLFGAMGADGKKRPFSLYAMRQAIEEGFILDALENYTTYNAYWNLRKKIEEDPRYDKRKATWLIKNFVDAHEEAIRQKVIIMIEHFAEQVAQRINGRAKAMIVTRSRLHAVYTRQAVDAYLAEQGYPFKALVAFSGTVKDPKTGLEFTETKMNSTPDEYIPETATAEAFKRPAYRLLIVANKFQTGFDQPLLHTMYVDKKLGGVNAVQTLSRLNRTHPGKEETMVLDFVNEAEAIQKAFEPYYEAAILSRETDPNVLYELQHEIEGFRFYSQAELDTFVRVYYTGRNPDLGKLYTLLAPVKTRFEAAGDEEQNEFRGKLRDFVRLYGFLAQIASFTETDWEKLFHFGRLLLRYLPPPSDGYLPLEVQQAIDLTTLNIRQSFSGRISLKRGEGELDPAGRGVGSGGPAPEEMEPLSQIIAELNDRFGIKTNGDAEAAIEHLQTKLAEDPGLAASVKVNTRDAARLTFNHVAQDLFEDLIDNYFKFYKQVTDDTDARNRFFDWLFERYLSQTQD